MEKKILEFLKDKPNKYFSLSEIEQALNETEIEFKIRRLIKYKLVKEKIVSLNRSMFILNFNKQEIYEGLEQMKKDKEDKILRFIELIKWW